MYSERNMKATDFRCIVKNYLRIQHADGKETMSQKWHHSQITSEMSLFCSHHFICEELVNAAYNTQNISAADTQQTPYWRCICLSQLAKLILTASFIVCNHCSSNLWATAQKVNADTWMHAETPGCQYYFSSSCSIRQMMCALCSFTVTCCICRVCFNTFTTPQQCINPETLSANFSCHTAVL